MSEEIKGPRVNGKDWKESKGAFRVKSLGVSKQTKYAKRNEKKLQEEQYKARLTALQDEKNQEKQARIDALKRRREIKAEKERFEMMAVKMNKRKVERLKRKEKRNKMLKER